MIGGGDTGNDCVGNGDPTGGEIRHSAGDDAEAIQWSEQPVQSVAAVAAGTERLITVRKKPSQSSDTIRESINNGKRIPERQKRQRKESRHRQPGAEKDEKSGRMMMVPIEGSEKVIDAQLVLIAAVSWEARNTSPMPSKIDLTREPNVLTKTGRIRNQRSGCFYSRRYAPRSVPGSLGNPGRKRGSKRSG